MDGYLEEPMGEGEGIGLVEKGRENSGDQLDPAHGTKKTKGHKSNYWDVKTDAAQLESWGGNTS